jgi:hypothetical protein
MKPLVAIVIAGMLCSGCAPIAPTPEPARNALDQADAKLAAADYSGAQALYAEFVNANPGNPQAARAHAIQVVLDRLLSSQTELDRLSLLISQTELDRLSLLISQTELDRLKRSEEVPRLRRELAERQGEVERLKADNAKLRADLERLRNIDLQTLPGAKK